MENLNLNLINGVYTLEGFDVSVDEWKDMICNSKIFDEKSLEMVKQWYYEDKHLSSSKIMTAKYHPELRKTPYNGIVVVLGKRILKHLNRYIIEYADESECFWITVFEGWYEEKDFIWKLRENICKALEELHLVGDSNSEKPNFYIFPCDTSFYNVYGAFEKYNEIYWRQNLKEIKLHDKVFIYVSKPESKLSFYCEVVEVNRSYEQSLAIDESNFYLHEDVEIKKYNYVRLKLIKRIYDDRFNFEILKSYGIKNNIQGQQELSGNALEYILGKINYNYLNIPELEENIEMYKLLYLPDDQKKFKSTEIVRREFLKKFSIDNIDKIKLGNYCLGEGTNDNFSYFLEIRLKDTGSIRGGSAQKFGVFKNEFGVYTVVPKWSKNKKADEALKNIKESIKEVIVAGENYDLFTLEKNKLATVVKGKILATYYPAKYLGVFGDEDFDHFFYKLGVPLNRKLSPVRKQYQLLKLKQENDVFDSLSFDEFMSFLYLMYGQDLLAKKKEDNKRNFKKKDEGLSESNEGTAKYKKKNLVKEEYKFIGNSKIKHTVKRKGTVDFETINKKRTAVGLTGEDLVYRYECDFLRKNGLKLKPDHIALREPSAGYDILSYDEQGNKKYIEVKTKKGKSSSMMDFYLTYNEKEKFETLEGYVIYYVSDLNSDSPKLRIITKEIFDKLELEPIAYHIKAEIKVID